MMPQHDHPLTLAYIAGARATTYQALRDAVAVIRSFETDENETLVAQCKLAAEVLIEREMR
jgi:hypothetical protein